MGVNSEEISHLDKIKAIRKNLVKRREEKHIRLIHEALKRTHQEPQNRFEHVTDIEQVQMVFYELLSKIA